MAAAAKRPIAEVIELQVSKYAHNIGVRLPEGQTPEAVARQAVELRKTMRSIDAVADHLGVRRNSLGRMMDIVAIADRTDLSERDQALARTALEALNQSRAPLLQIHASLAPIRERVWGETTRGGTGVRERFETNRRTRFHGALGVLTQACANGVRLELPQLAPEDAQLVENELHRAKRDIDALIKKVRGIHR